MSLKAYPATRPASYLLTVCVCVVQYHEVVGFLCGRFMGWVTAFFVIIYVFGISIAQVVACSSDAYYWRTHLDKR